MADCNKKYTYADKEYIEHMLQTATVMFNATHNAPTPEAMVQSQRAYKEYVEKVVMLHSEYTQQQINDIVWQRFQEIREKENEDNKYIGKSYRNKKRYGMTHKP